MDLKHLTDTDLLKNTEQAASRERLATTDLLHHLIEVERRRLFSKVRCSSLFDYCVKILKMSEPQAARRVNAARTIKEFPAIETKLKSGALNMTAISQAHCFFKKESANQKPLSTLQKTDILEKLEHQSTREADKILLSHSATPEIHRKEFTRPISANLTEARLNLDQETMANLKRLQEIWSHEMPNASLSDVVKKAARLAREQVDPILKAIRSHEKLKGRTKSAATPAPESSKVHVNQNYKIKTQSRYVPAEVKHQVWLRDEGKCTYRDEHGKLCSSRHRLQLDHIKPFAQGGENTVDNLRLRCFAHNQWHAIQTYGPRVLKYARL
jgi:5-methylcytosine-specific restriction endonuclease McrA